MFTGLVQEIGIVCELKSRGENRELTIVAQLAGEMAVGDSVAISGVCLTAENVSSERGAFTSSAVAETLAKSTLGRLSAGARVNLELALRPHDRLGGHFVQGHVDALGRCESVTQADGSWVATFSYPEEFAELLVEKGSVAVDGVSLTAYAVTADKFQVSIIPHTWMATTLSALRPGSAINLEFDILGKYVQRRREVKDGALSWETLTRYGY